jgi:hypothetical protein
MATDTEFLTWLEGFADRNGVPRAPCPAIVKVIGPNPALQAEMMSMKSIDDYYERGSPALRAAVDQVVPPRDKLKA